MKYFTIFYIICLSHFLLLNVYPSLGDESHKRQVLIDTDMGLDDARAIAWLFEMHDIHIVGIITSDGVLDPENGLNNLKIVLEYFSREEIPICSGMYNDGQVPPFRQTVNNAFSRFPTPSADFTEYKMSGFFNKISKSVEDGTLTYLSLGPLTNLKYLLEKEPEFINKINKILYAGNSPENEESSWNTERDIQACKSIFNFFDNIVEINISNGYDPFFNNELISVIQKSSNHISEFIKRIHGINEDPDEGNIHMFIYDDLLPLFMQYPEFFSLGSSENEMAVEDMNIFFLQSAYSHFIENGFILTPRPSVVFNKYPIHDAAFKDDVTEHIDTLIRIHGLEEWKAAILTNEMHRHLGAYSLVGVKMGILARELFEADLDELKVVVFTESKPPESCLIDGLQIATGASLGRGTIRVSNEIDSLPNAVFIKDSRRIRIVLRMKIIQRIQSDIEYNVKKFGYGTQRYFEEVRKMSIQLWVNLNRKYMFDVYDDRSGEKIL